MDHSNLFEESNEKSNYTFRYLTRSSSSSISLSFCSNLIYIERTWSPKNS
jgi:hypothetical protein